MASESDNLQSGSEKVMVAESHRVRNSEGDLAFEESAGDDVEMEKPETRGGKLEFLPADSDVVEKERPGTGEQSSNESIIIAAADEGNADEIGYRRIPNVNNGLENLQQEDKNNQEEDNSSLTEILVEVKGDNAEDDIRDESNEEGKSENREVPAILREGEGVPAILPETIRAPPDLMESQVVGGVLADGEDAMEPRHAALQSSINGNSGSSTMVHEDINELNLGNKELSKLMDSGKIGEEVHSTELIERALGESESFEDRDVSINMDASVGEKKEPLQEETLHPGVSSQFNGNYASGKEELRADVFRESEAELSAEIRNGDSEQFADTNGSERLKLQHVAEEVDGKGASGDGELAVSESLRKDAHSEEKQYGSRETGKNGTLGGVMQSSSVRKPSRDSTDPRHDSPAGLGSSVPPLEPTHRVQQSMQAGGTAPKQWDVDAMGEPTSTETEYDETREKLQMIRVKFLRLVHRLGQTSHNAVVAQVLYRLGLAEQLRGSRTNSRTGAFNFDRASAMAEQLEATSQEPLGFSCTIMVIGKTGVGKSATINSIFEKYKFSTDAFHLGTKKVQEIVGSIHGIEVKVIDTPGLLSSCLDQPLNKKILRSLKNSIKKSPPDIVLYLDRLDMQNSDHGDLPLLRTVTEIFGASIWFNAIVVFTHAASAPPEGPNGVPLTYDMIVAQRSQLVQQAIRQAAGDTRLMNPVSLVENHSACRINRSGQRVLPNGQIWRTNLLLLSFASKILAEANNLLKLQDSPPGKPYGTRAKIPSLPFLLSSLLQSRPPLKLPQEQFGDDEVLDYDMDEASDSDGELDYDKLPPFKSLSNAEVAKLTKKLKKAYFDELDYREMLFLKKQLKEEKRQRKLLRKMAESAEIMSDGCNENLEGEGGATSIPVPVPDMPLPNSFDSDYPTHRYRYLDNFSQWLVRPVLESHGWDHDVGYEGVNIERLFVVKNKIPVSVSGQVTKDKKESNLQMDLNSSIKHHMGNVTSFGFDMQSVGKDMSYTLRSEMRCSNFRCNKTAAGLSVNFLGDTLSTGVKFEDILLIYKRLRLTMNAGAMTSRGDVAYGGSLEATLRDKDYPLGRTLLTLGLSVMDWHRDHAVGWNLQSQFPVGRKTNMIARANLNKKGAGQISVQLNSSEQFQIALVALVPLFQSFFNSGLFGSSHSML